ncbi:MAG: DUF6378 domain-containing protein [Candidatus Gastranaerophilales bacterium]|nr:DUF6378 domain-containing protein [Candidatus Gastranaerophilales bacterium]
MKRDECLDRAMKSVCGGRELDYGSPENNFAVIAQLWDVYFQAKCMSDVYVEIDSDDVANMMVLFKLGRVISGTATSDSYVDMAGYAACACELATYGENQPEKSAKEAGYQPHPIIDPIDHTIQYKGWTGVYDYSKEDTMYVGKLLSAKAGDCVHFHGSTLKELAEHFVSAIEEYLEAREILDGKKKDVNNVVSD